MVFYIIIPYFQKVKQLLVYVQILFLFACSSPNLQLSKVTGKRIEIDSVLPTNKAIDEIVAPYRKELKKEMDKPLSKATKNLVGNDGELQSSLGNLLADLSFEMGNPVFNEKTKTSIDFVMMNAGGLRAPISKGVVTVQNAFSLMPFENDLVVVKLSGEKVKMLFEYFIEKQRPHPLSKNVQLVIAGEAYSIKINGVPFDEKHSYYVLTNDYLQNGGDGMDFFADPEELIGLDYKVRDAILDYFAKVKVLEATLDNRVIIKK